MLLFFFEREKERWQLFPKLGVGRGGTQRTPPYERGTDKTEHMFDMFGDHCCRLMR